MDKFKIFLRIFKDVWKLSPLLLIYSLIIRIIVALIPSYHIIILALMVDSLTKSLTNHQHTNEIYLLLIYVGLILLQSLLSKVNQLINQKLTQLWTLNFNKRILNTLSTFDLEYFENRSSYDNIRIAQMGQNGIQIFDQGMMVFQSMISLMSLVVVLFNVNKLLPFILLIGIIPSFFTTLKLAKYRYQTLITQSPEERKAGYLSTLFMQRDSVKEIKIYNLASYLIDKWYKIFTKQQDIKYDLAKKEAKNLIFSDISQQIVYILVFGYLFTIASNNNQITAGMFISTLQTLAVLQGFLQLIITSVVSMIETTKLASDLYKLIDSSKIEENENESINKLIDKITINNLSFTYPNGTKAINNVNFEIKPKDRIVVVGANGSGKSTLAKCLSALYRSYQGEILWDNREIRSINKHNFYQHLSYVFQDYTKYQLSIRENVGFGDISKIMNDEQILESIHSAGLESKVNKTNLDNILGIEFGNSDFSEGQWQRLAISRALFRNSSLIILDEPTSAIDPLSEIQLYTDFLTATEGKTSIFISHRMGVCKNADLILVMKNGELIEKGTHLELISSNSEYKKMFESQSSWYI